MARAAARPKRNTAPLAVSLQDLGGLKKALQDAAHSAAEQAAAAREKAERERRERHLFTVSVGNVELSKSWPPRHCPAPVRRPHRVNASWTKPRC